MTKPITVEVVVQAPLQKVWASFVDPEAITKWNQASDDWHTTKSRVDLRVGGSFSSRMEAKDGSASFDFEGVYDVVVPHEHLAYTMADGRHVDVTFEEHGDTVRVVETFDPETEHSVELQREGWQAILDNFKKFVEKLG